MQIIARGAHQGASTSDANRGQMSRLIHLLGLTTERRARAAIASRVDSLANAHRLRADVDGQPAASLMDVRAARPIAAAMAPPSRDRRSSAPVDLDQQRLGPDEYGVPAMQRLTASRLPLSKSSARRLMIRASLVLGRTRGS